MSDPLEGDLDSEFSADPEDIGFVPDNNDFMPYWPWPYDYNLGEMEEE